MCTSWCFDDPYLETLLATCFDRLGVTSPGAPPRDRRNRSRPLCVCVGHPEPTTRQWLDVNCGQRVQKKGQVRKWHKPPPGYDHHAIVHEYNERKRERHQARIAARPPLGYVQSAGLLDDLVFPLLNLDTVELSLTELESEKAKILRENWDVLDPLRKIPAYFGMTVRDPIEVTEEPGRFLHNLGRRNKKATVPMLQFAEQNYMGHTIFSQKETRDMGFKTRLVFESYEMFQACQVEEHLQSTCVIFYHVFIIPVRRLTYLDLCLQNTSNLAAHP